MTAIQATTSTQNALIRYHNRCVTRAAGWSSCCEGVVHLQVYEDSSPLATILKVASFAIVSIGLLICDVLHEGWTRGFSSSEPQATVTPEPQAQEPKTPAKPKAADPTPKKPPKQAPEVVDLTGLQRQLAELSVAIESNESTNARLGEIEAELGVIKDRIGSFAAKTNLAKTVGRLEANLAEVSTKIDAFAQKIAQPPARRTRFSEDSIIHTPSHVREQQRKATPWKAGATPATPGHTPGKPASSPSSSISSLSLTPGENRSNANITGKSLRTIVVAEETLEQVNEILREKNLELGNQDLDEPPLVTPRGSKSPLMSDSLMVLSPIKQLSARKKTLHDPQAPKFFTPGNDRMEFTPTASAKKSAQAPRGILKNTPASAASKPETPAEQSE